LSEEDRESRKKNKEIRESTKPKPTPEELELRLAQRRRKM
jgi:hypothetical protein